MHLVCCCSLPVWRRSSLKKGTPRYLSWPRPGSAPGRIWPKNNNTCKGPWVLHPYQVPSKSIKRFWRRSWKCKLSNGRQTDDRRTTDGRQTDDRRTTDGRQTDGRRTTDYGQCVITIGHWSLWLLCPKKGKQKIRTSKFYIIYIKIKLRMHDMFVTCITRKSYVSCQNKGAQYYLCSTQVHWRVLYLEQSTSYLIHQLNISTRKLLSI